LAPLVGLVGKANVGKSTFFSAATLKPVEIAAFPFTTIKPNRGVAYLRASCVCGEFNVQDNPVNSACVDRNRLVPVELIDCPGLIRGAHVGKGLGNQFLDEVRKADALIVVCDAAGASDENGQPCAPGSHDPLEDVEIFEEEFDLWLLGLVRQDWERVTRVSEAARKNVSEALEQKLSGLGIDAGHVAQAMGETGLDPYKPTAWGREEQSRFVTELRRASKPMIVAANKADQDVAEENVKRLREAGYRVVPTSAEAELTLRRAAGAGMIRYRPGDGDFEVLKPESLTVGQRRGLELIRERVLKRWNSTGVQEVLNAAFFSLLDSILVYPVEDAERLSDHAGRVLPDVYLVKKGTTAREFAGLIHADLKESFLFAIDARTKRRLGEDYVLQNNDVLQIVATKARK
jgi:hypothetical protein